MFKKCLASLLDSGVALPNAALPHPFTTPETSCFAWLAAAAPCFALHSTSVRILHAPSDFHSALMQCCRSVSRRLTLASLYLGTSDLEAQLIATLLQNEQLAQLQINVLLDYSRASRCSNNSRCRKETPKEAIDADSCSFRRMLRPLLQKANNCNLSLYHTPMLRGIFKRLMPNRWNELFGVQHMKLYIFDDTLIISGANLSRDYFSNRIDRYYIIEDKSLCDFFDGLVKRVQDFSIAINADDTEALGRLGSPYQGSRLDFVRRAGESIQEYLHQSRLEQSTNITTNCDTWIFPLLQMGQLGLQQDHDVTSAIFAKAPSNSRLHIATAYFNLTNSYVNNLIFDSRAECHLLVAHPKANGFLGAKGMAGGIPGGYTLLARRFQDKVEKHCQDKRIRLWEYLREGWTFHAKGLWYYAPGSSFPCLTLLGSSNFGDRSVLKDLETQIALVTVNPQLQEQLHAECTALYQCGIPGDFRMKIPQWVHAMVLLFKNYF